MPMTHRRNQAKSGQFKASLQNDGTLEILIYGEIVDAATISMLEAWGYSTDGFVSALAVKKAMEAASGYTKIRLRINSPGGDAFEGMAIHSLLIGQGKPVETYIDGIAASSASIVAMAGSVRVMGPSAMMMIHDAWCYVCGNATDLRKMGETLDKIDDSIAAAYVGRTGLTIEAVKALMDAESWLSAQDCFDQGFATAIAELPQAEEQKAMARAKRFKALGRLKHVPDALRPAAKAVCECECAACQDGDCASCSNQECEDPDCVDCPMQADDTSDATLLNPAAAVKPADAVEPVINVVDEPKPAPAQEESNLSWYRAKTRMLLRKQ